MSATTFELDAQQEGFKSVELGPRVWNLPDVAAAIELWDEQIVKEAV